MYPTIVLHLGFICSIYIQHSFVSLSLSLDHTGYEPLQLYCHYTDHYCRPHTDCLHCCHHCSCPHLCSCSHHGPYSHPVQAQAGQLPTVIEWQDRVMTWCTWDGHWVHTIIIVFVQRRIMIFILGLVLFNYVLNMLRWVPLFPTVVDKGSDDTAQSAVFSTHSRVFWELYPWNIW